MDYKQFNGYYKSSFRDDNNDEQEHLGTHLYNSLQMITVQVSTTSPPPSVQNRHVYRKTSMFDESSNGRVSKYCHHSGKFGWKIKLNKRASAWWCLRWYSRFLSCQTLIHLIYTNQCVCTHELHFTGAFIVYSPTDSKPISRYFYSCVTTSIAFFFVINSINP